jgi:hypothetical protein
MGGDVTCERRSVASPTIENTNRLVGWLRGMEALRQAIGAAA